MDGLIKEDQTSCFKQQRTDDGSTRKYIVPHWICSRTCRRDPRERFGRSFEPTAGVPVGTELFDSLSTGRDLHGPKLSTVPEGKSSCFVVFLPQRPAKNVGNLVEGIVR
jgi:hypothetical protein